MNTPLIIWFCIAIIAGILLIARIYNEIRRHSSRRRFRLLSLAHEWEEFFVPGDKIYHENPKDDYDDI